MTESPTHTGTISETCAELQQERVKAIMVETDCTFSQACDQYIREREDRINARCVPRAFIHT